MVRHVCRPNDKDGETLTTRPPYSKLSSNGKLYWRTSPGTVVGYLLKNPVSLNTRPYTPSTREKYFLCPITTANKIMASSVESTNEDTLTDRSWKSEENVTFELPSDKAPEFTNQHKHVYILYIAPHHLYTRERHVNALRSISTKPFLEEMVFADDHPDIENCQPYPTPPTLCPFSRDVRFLTVDPKSTHPEDSSMMYNTISDLQHNSTRRSHQPSKE